MPDSRILYHPKRSSSLVRMTTPYSMDPTPTVARHPTGTYCLMPAQGSKRSCGKIFGSHPTHCQDLRQGKTASLHLDFRHKRSEQGLWLDHRPAWVDSDLPVWNWQLQIGDKGTRKVEELRRVCKEGPVAEAVAALDILLEQECSVGVSLFYLVLKRCIAHSNLILGRRVHDLIVKGGCEGNGFLSNHIVRMYSSHGRLQEAVQVFRKVTSPQIFIWCSIISAHAAHGQPAQAVHLYRQMRQSSVKPNSYVFVAVLKACGIAMDLESGKEVHTDILRSGVEAIDVFVGCSLVDMYAKCGSLEDARRVFDSLCTKNVVTWTAMIAGYSQHGFCEEALDLYARMEQGGMAPADHVTFLCLLKACASTGSLQQGKHLHAQIQERGLEIIMVVANCLVDMYAKCGSLADARRAFDMLPKRDVVTWNTMIAGYAQQGFGQEALTLYACLEKELTTVADQVTFICVLQACGSLGAFHQGKRIHSQIRDRGLEKHLVVGNALIDMYAKCGSPEDAQQVFESLPTRDVVTWTAMLSAYAHEGLAQRALNLYAEMQREGISPVNHITFVCLLQACASVGAFNQGKQLHAQIQDKGLEGNVVVANALVDMYVKCGSLEEARNVFIRQPTKDVVTWTALLNGYAQHTNAWMAMQCFERMLLQGVTPNGATFISLLVACSHEGLVKEGVKYFRTMEEHGVVPTDRHYNCMVDLFARSGHLEEAESLLQIMPFKNSLVGWTSLLSAVKNHGDVERGERCFDVLVTLEPESASAYAMMANLYANAGRWRDVGRIEALRKCAGAWKKPAKACIEVESKVHEFTVGESSGDISEKLRIMNSQLRNGGHVPQTELVLKRLSETEKEDALCGHAEKLALAYGLLNTSDGTTLIVTKNLRMCSDCHSSTKVMSRLEKREIIVRDAHRVHRFQDGICSCGDRH